MLTHGGNGLQVQTEKCNSFFNSLLVCPYWTFQQLDLRLSHDFAFDFTVENPGWNVSFSKLGKEESLHEYSLHFRVCSFKNVYRLHFFKDCLERKCLNSLNTKFH